MRVSPTEEFYGLLQNAYEIFNQELFDGQLSDCLLTLQREKKTMGYFSEDRWINTEGKKTHELALNPSYFGSHKIIEIFQTLVHEQCHLWQLQFGKPSRRSYHNQEWSDKMESIGLMPSSTGSPGGKRTGQRMSDYPISDGKFLDVAKRLIKNGISITWFDRYAATTEPSQIRDSDFQAPNNVELELLYTTVSQLVKNTDSKEQPLLIAAKTPTRIKYTCPCNNNVWGKPDLILVCGSCSKSFEES